MLNNASESGTDVVYMLNIMNQACMSLGSRIISETGNEA